MNQDLLTKLYSVAAQADSLASDYRRGRLWERDMERRLGAISDELSRANTLAKEEARGGDDMK